MSFDWNKWAEGGSNPSELPVEERMKMRAAWDRIPSVDPLEALMRGNTPNDDEDGPLKRSDVLGIFQEASRQAEFKSEIAGLKRDLGENYDKYAPAAKPLIERGYSPNDAFRLAGMEDALAIATEKARTDALAGVQTGARNSEQNARGNGAQGSGASNTRGGDGNVYIDDPELYKKERDRLGSARTDFQEARRFRIEHPEFVEAEKHHEDLVGVSRR